MVWIDPFKVLEDILKLKVIFNYKISLDETRCLIEDIIIRLRIKLIL